MILVMDVKFMKDRTGVLDMDNQRVMLEELIRNLIEEKLQSKLA